MKSLTIRTREYTSEPLNQMLGVIADHNVSDAGYAHWVKVDERHAVVVEQTTVHEHVAVDNNSKLARANVSAHEAVLGHAVTKTRHDVVVS